MSSPRAGRHGGCKVKEHEFIKPSQNKSWRSSKTHVSRRTWGTHGQGDWRQDKHLGWSGLDAGGADNKEDTPGNARSSGNAESKETTTKTQIPTNCHLHGPEHLLWAGRVVLVRGVYHSFHPVCFKWVSVTKSVMKFKYVDPHTHQTFVNLESLLVRSRTSAAGWRSLFYIFGWKISWMTPARVFFSLWHNSSWIVRLDDAQVDI